MKSLRWSLWNEASEKKSLKYVMVALKHVLYVECAMWYAECGRRRLEVLSEFGFCAETVVHDCILVDTELPKTSLFNMQSPAAQPENADGFE